MKSCLSKEWGLAGGSRPGCDSLTSRIPFLTGVAPILFQGLAPENFCILIQARDEDLDIVRGKGGSDSLTL